MRENPYRKDFPIFDNQNIVYLDSAATAQRPYTVLEKERSFYENMNANPLRGLYGISVEATGAYAHARERVAGFIGAASAEEIVFTRNATESLNLVAYSYACSVLKKGDRIVTTIMEHHSNMLPWRLAAERTGADIVYMLPDKKGKITAEEISSKITKETKLVAIGHISNVLGVTNPVKEIAAAAHAMGAAVVLDAAQSVPHIPVNVQDLDVDFLAFSGHKLMAPFGIGVLYGRRELLEAMPPFLRGGEMIDSVSIEGETFAPIPHKFEAGTVNAAGAVALEAAIDYIEKVGFDFIGDTERFLTEILFEEAAGYPYFHILGSDRPEEHSGIVAFTIDGVHPHDVSSILDGEGICIRAGHHCAEPLLKYLGEMSTARASLYLYNTEEDVRYFMEKVKGVRRYLGFGD